jgi:hypothetical protein
MSLASLLGWLAAFGIVVVIACRFVAARRHAGSTAAADKSPAAQRKAALRQDLAYLTKQAAELRQLKQAARASGNEYDKCIEALEWREYVGDAVRFIVAAQAEGWKESSKGAENIRNLLRSLGLTDAEFERLLSDTAQFQGLQNSP